LSSLHAPNNAEPVYNIAGTLRSDMKYEQAVQEYRRALSIDPNHASSHANMGMTLLMLGDFQHGWDEYEWRFRSRDLKQKMVDLRPAVHPIWNGETFEGKTLFIRTEQGSGDMIMCVRYAALAKERGGTVVMEVRPNVRRLVSGVKGVDRFVEWQPTIPQDADYEISLMSLPRIFSRTESGIPAAVPYLFAEPDIIDNTRTLMQSAKLRVGLSWQGNKDFPNDKMRSMPFEKFLPILNVPGVQFYSLQRGYGSEQLSILDDPGTVIDLTAVDDGPDAFVGTAGAMQHLDLIITTDTSIPHLAGALGRPVWVLLHKPAEWRWMLERTTSPWYPTMRLFRQPGGGDWESVIANVRVALDEVLARHV
jgi:hypothetical protein